MEDTVFNTLSEYADYFLGLNSETVTLTIAGVYFGLEYEGLLLETVAMARTNGVAVMFTRGTSDKLIWYRFHCSGKTSSVAWLLYERESIGKGERGKDKPILES